MEQQNRAQDFLPQRKALRLERYLDGVVETPRRDLSQLSGLHGYFGGVYSENRYVNLSGLTRSRGTRVIYAYDGERQEPVKQSGRALYAGPLFPHYGHFLVESTARLWACEFEDFDHIVYQVAPGASRQLHPFQREFFDRAGLLSRLCPISCDDMALRFDEVVVAEPALYICDKVSPLYASVFRRVAVSSTAAPSRRIYMSRLNLQQGVVIGEDVLEELFAHLDFEIYYPEQHSFAEQLDLYSEVAVLAGASGSALHNVLFMPPHTRVIDLVRSAATLSTFYLIDNVAEADAFYVEDIANKEVEGYPVHGAQGPFILDIDHIIQSLSSCPFINQEKLESFIIKQSDLEQKYKAEWHFIAASHHRAQGRVDDCRISITKSLECDPHNMKFANMLNSL